MSRSRVEFGWPSDWTLQVIVGVGPINHGHLVELVQKHFANQPSKPVGQVPYSGPSRFTSASVPLFLLLPGQDKVKTWLQMEYRDDTLPMCYTGVGFEGLAAGDPRNNALEVIKSIVGSFNRARQPVGDHGLNIINDIGQAPRFEGEMRVFEFDFYNINYRDNGMFGAYVACEESDWVPNNTLKRFFKEMCR